MFRFLFFKTDGPIFLDNKPAAFNSSWSGRSFIDSKSFLKSLVGSKSFLMFFISEIEFLTSLRSLSSAISLSDFLNSLELSKYGNRVKWLNNVFSLPRSFLSCLIASRKGSPSISPTVPPISHKTTSSFFVLSVTKFFISFVTCGIIWTVAPKSVSYTHLKLPTICSV